LLSLLTSPALAIPTLSLVWQETGTTSIDVSSTFEQTIVADVVLDLQAGDESWGAFVSFVFDEDLGDELDFVFLWERQQVDFPNGGLWRPVVRGQAPSVTTESDATTAGSALGFDSAIAPVQGGGLSNGGVGPVTVTLGTVAFRTNPTNIATDGADLSVAIQLNGIDAFLDSDGSVICGATTPCDGLINFPGASVNIPEPASGLLIGTSILGLLYAKRRR